ncbi:MAG: signal peptide peptidase SppA [Actinomycetota bacterium]|nr:signal peptide peptidase SppA [Actinomycetota bacterium]
MNEEHSALRPPSPPPTSSYQGGGSGSGRVVAIVAIVLVAFLVVLLLCVCFILPIAFSGRPHGKRVGLVEINGIISSSGEGSLFEWGTSAERVIEELDRARKDREIKAIVIRISSPGGTPAGAQEIYREIIRTKKEKPVVVSIGDVGASGAYYIASAADFIFASADSNVGSIGVILEIPNLEELYNKMGVEYTVITKGKYKDIGSPLRQLTPEEAQILDAQMQATYDNFIADVASGRKMKESRVRELATGLTWPGEEAKRLGLIDSIGNLRDAARKAGRMGGIKGEVELVPVKGGRSLSLISELLTTLKELVKKIDVSLEKKQTLEIPSMKR